MEKQNKTQTTTLPSERTRIRRIAENANNEKAMLYSIIDEAYLCHIAFQDEKGMHCIPTACWREDDFLYVHAANASRLAKVLGRQQQICVTITHLDGLVLARAAFNHSMNYRSAMIYGSFEQVHDPEHKAKSMERFMDKVASGRQTEVRPGNHAELAGTSLMRIALVETACKVRRGGPKDDAEDSAIPVWTGELPLKQMHQPPVPDPANQTPTPNYVTSWYQNT
ncbi:pyridoxamine 5'-phosphate oxidase family protein [Undibacterium fentianense]|uniref:Pyridoxamine 5'-phosphate oxidase family protein n=1 Tax=Undibacterium fentianense TaxID=2828728 RepID=A0A941E5B1_9BURK|nr:pyridoxamine 5'-phosphate oxidase family protein [Undibacterium fentianense]MBR7801342.1 pyridoxamine 5'-phosphate oxidase family protein [Undibacterium fentianense]